MTRAPAWAAGRGTLMNVLLFGVGPLALIGIIVAAYVLVSPGKGSASSLSFKAGPAVTSSSDAATAPASSATPSPSASHGKRKRGTPSPSPSVKVPGQATPKPKASHKPAHRSGGAVVPHNLGVPNFAGYCQHIGQRTAELTASNAYGWHCTLYPTRVLQVLNACAWTYHLSTSKLIDVSANYNDPNAWQCWRINRDLGVLNVTTYCTDAGLGTSRLVVGNAYGWDCTSPLAPVNTNSACDIVYHVSDAVSRFAVFADPYSWQCWN